MIDPLLFSAIQAPAPAHPGRIGAQARYEMAKAVVDRLIAGVLLLLFAPVMLIIAIVIRLDSAGPALYQQKRIGKNGVVFTLLKFRSMRIDTPSISTAEMQQLKLSPVTRVGAFLRRTSLDELPQLWNILCGEMSLVGPRPALPSQTYLNELRTRAGVDSLLPGITGWAQINGRDNLSDEQKVAHDAYYRHHRSLKLDMTILARTILPVITGRGNY